MRPRGLIIATDNVSNTSAWVDGAAKTVVVKKYYSIVGQRVALRSNGVMIHRYTARRNEPRGMFCAIGRCTDCIMVVNGRPNIRTCVEPLKAGMAVETQTGKG